jgi:hypothetical protein
VHGSRRMVGCEINLYGVFRFEAKRLGKLTLQHCQTEANEVAHTIANFHSHRKISGNCLIGAMSHQISHKLSLEGCNCYLDISKVLEMAFFLLEIKR